MGGLWPACMPNDRSLVTKYNLPVLVELDHRVADLVGVDIPFNNYITGFTAFTHKAGIHAKAVLNDPSTYEALKPEDFGLARYIHIAHRLTGWNAVRHRAEQLNLSLSDEQIKQITQQIKVLSDEQPLIWMMWIPCCITPNTTPPRIPGGQCRRAGSIVKGEETSWDKR